MNTSDVLHEKQIADMVWSKWDTTIVIVVVGVAVMMVLCTLCWVRHAQKKVSEKTEILLTHNERNGQPSCLLKITTDQDHASKLVTMVASKWRVKEHSNLHRTSVALDELSGASSSFAHPESFRKHSRRPTMEPLEDTVVELTDNFTRESRKKRRSKSKKSLV